MSTFPISGYLPSHRPWTADELLKADFARYLVLKGKIVDGESVEELARFRKLQHLHDRRRPADWTLIDCQRHEAKPVVARQADETTAYDPAESGSA